MDYPKQALIIYLLTYLRLIWLVKLHKSKILNSFLDLVNRVKLLRFHEILSKVKFRFSNNARKNWWKRTVNLKYTKQVSIKSIKAFFVRFFEAFLENMNCTKKNWTHYDIICINAIYLVNNDQKIISKVRGAFLWFIGGSFLATRRWWWPPMHSVRFCQILVHFIILSYFWNHKKMW